eukprot:6176980-Pleurochrysis_carterae.AAC.3
MPSRMHLAARGSSSLHPCSASGQRAYARQNIGQKWRTEGGRPALRSCGVMLSSAAPPAVVRHVGDQDGLRNGVLPVLLAGAATLVYHAHGLMQCAHVGLAWSGSATARTHSCWCERAASKVAAMVALFAHKVGAQRGGELVPGCDEANVSGALGHVKERRPIAVARELRWLEWADQVRAGQLPATFRGGAFAKWHMDARCIGRKCGGIGQVVWLSIMRLHAGSRCICRDIGQMAHVLGRYTEQARTPQQCCVRHGELGRRSFSSLAAHDDISGDAMVLLADDELKLCRVEWPHMYSP